MEKHSTTNTRAHLHLRQEPRERSFIYATSSGQTVFTATGQKDNGGISNYHLSHPKVATYRKEFLTTVKLLRVRYLFGTQYGEVNNSNTCILDAVFDREPWRAPVIQLLGGRVLWMA